MFEIKFPKLDMLTVGIIFVGLAVTALVVFKVVVPKVHPPEIKILLHVPFSAQAPTNNWTRNEDCEETSIVMANAFLTGNTIDKLPASDAQKAIDNLKKWEGANLGYNANTGVEATTRMAEGAFGLRIKQIENYTAEDLKQELRAGNPVLLPINAKLLGSPQYLNDGPTYHMVVVKGFRDNIFIVNDPGTNQGNGNEYTFEVLKNSASDWNQQTKRMEPSRKFALVVSK